MKIEEKFNKREAQFAEVNDPNVDQGAHYKEGIRVRFYACDEYGTGDGRKLHMHMTPDEALLFAAHLVNAARLRIKS